jgi:hypothetical protein
MRTKVINFVGSPGNGKSLMSALTFAELKMMHKSCELVQEYAKQLVWQDRFAELDNQYQVSFEQYKTIKALDGKVEYVCCDSPLLLGLVYNKIHATNVSNLEKTEKMILSKMSEFQNVYIFLERGDFLYENAGRIHSEAESRDIQVMMRDLLDKHGLKYLVVKSDKQNLPKILDYILTLNPSEK